MAQNDLLALNRSRYSATDAHAGKRLIGSSQKPSKVYFPVKALLSAFHVMEDGQRVGLGLIGAEGFAPIGLTFDKPSWRYTIEVLIPGTTAEVPLRDFTKAIEQNAIFRKGVYRFIEDFIDQSLCTAACSVRHDVEERLARWLLMAHDRVQKDDMAITQNMLAESLGIGRQAVNTALRTFKDRGALDVRRSGVRIVSRRKLQKVSCECYARSPLT